MSSGDRAGGTSPVRGLGRSLIMERLLVLALLGVGSKEWERRSMPPGRSGRRAIAREVVGAGIESSAQCGIIETGSRVGGCVSRGRKRRCRSRRSRDTNRGKSRRIMRACRRFEGSGIIEVCCVRQY
jgi:hypothetical protein